YNGGLVQWRSARLTDLKLLERLRESGTSADAARVDYLLGLVHLERGDARAAVDVLGKTAGAGAGQGEIGTALGQAQALSAQALSAQAGQLIRTFEGHTEVVKSVALSPDGRLALSGGGVYHEPGNRALRLWELSSGRCLRTFEGHTAEVNSVS